MSNLLNCNILDPNFHIKKSSFIKDSSFFLISQIWQEVIIMWKEESNAWPSQKMLDHRGIFHFEVLQAPSEKVSLANQVLFGGECPYETRRSTWYKPARIIKISQTISLGSNALKSLLCIYPTPPH